MKIETRPPLTKPIVKVKKPNAKGELKKVLKRYSGIVMYTLIIGLLIIGSIYLVGGDSYSFSSYLWLQLLVLILAILHYIGSARIFEWAKPIGGWRSITFNVILAGLGVLLIFLSRYWEWLPTLPFTYAFAMLLFFAPLVYMIAYRMYCDIPVKIFKPWVYPYGKEIPVVEVINPIKVKFYIAKKQEDDEYTEFALNVPHKYKLGEFMHYFIHRYNYDKNPEQPIYLSKNNSRDNLYQWLFKAKPGTTTNSQVYDPDKSFNELGIKENDSIIVERYFTKKEIDTNRKEEILEEINEDSLDNLTTKPIKSETDAENM